MHETAEDLKNLQLLLNRSYERAGSHLREVVTPERRVSAARLIDLMAGVQVLALATVTADGRPLIGAVDGLFYRARFWFGSSPDSVRMRHLRTRPFVSVTHIRDQSLAVTVHGRAGMVDPEDPVHTGFRAFCLETYGEDWEEWGAPALYARIEPAKMFAVAFDSV
ncbi:MAG TPA: pyridoxamine 5'-phosphate oxidase family protein [Acidimicrobiia bacterium]|nr:pyridoxamine 5'-phosphate oxidase family protein [Acidimicrobiia bacterium]